MYKQFKRLLNYCYYKEKQTTMLNSLSSSILKHQNKTFSYYYTNHKINANISLEREGIFKISTKNRLYSIHKNSFSSKHSTDSSNKENNKEENTRNSHNSRLEKEYIKLDYYAILGVTTKSEISEIKKCYYKLAKAFHPDKYTGSPEVFRKITEAYKTLTTPSLREKYDAKFNMKLKNKSKYSVYSDGETKSKYRMYKKGRPVDENEGEYKEFYTEDDKSRYQKTFDSLDKTKMFNKFYKSKLDHSDDYYYNDSIDKTKIKIPESHLKLDRNVLEKLGEIKIVKSDMEKKMTKREIYIQKYKDHQQLDRSISSLQRGRIIIKEMLYQSITPNDVKKQHEEIEAELDKSYSQAVKDYGVKEYNSHKKQYNTKKPDAETKEEIKKQEKQLDRFVLYCFVFLFCTLSYAMVDSYVKKINRIKYLEEKERLENINRLRRYY